MTDINDFQFYMNCYDGYCTNPFVAADLPAITPIFDFNAMPATTWVPQFNLNFDFWNNQNSFKNIFNIDFGTNTQLPSFQSYTANLPFNMKNFNQMDFSLDKGMLDTFTPSTQNKILFTEMAEKTRKIAEKKPEINLTIGNYKPISIANYNAEKGKKFADLAKEYTHYGVKRQGSEWVIDKSKHKQSEGKASFTHQCARYVSIVLKDCGLAEYLHANGCQVASKLRNNPNFKEIPVAGTDWKNLPAGCVLCFNAGSQGYHTKWGHVEITQNNGTATSDGTTKNIRRPDAIFIPV